MYFLHHNNVMHPFVTISDAHLSIFTGEAMTAITRYGKVYKDNAYSMRNLADLINWIKRC